MIRFGHDGWHGQLAREVTFDAVETIARVAGTRMTADDPANAALVVGYDRRFLAAEFAGAISTQLASLGIEPWLITRPVPTPALSFAVRSLQAAGGIMVTASHLPPTVSGIKLRDADGGALARATLDEIETSLRSSQSIRPVGPTSSVLEIDPLDDYLALLARQAPVKAIQSAGITVAIDSQWGTASELLPRLTDGDGSRSVEIRTNHNPRYPDIQAPNLAERNLERLRRVIATGSAAFGVAFNGDGSAIALIDDQGTYIRPDMVAALVSYHLLGIEGRRGAVGRSIAASTAVERLVAAYRAPIHELGVGFTSISESIREHSLLFVTDETGAVIIPRFLPDRDGLLAALLIAACVVETGQSISELIDEVEEFIGHRSFRRVASPLTDEQMDLVQYRLDRDEWPLTIAGYNVTESYETDGVKLEFGDDAWLLLRCDDYERTLEIAAEAANDDVVDELLRAGRQLMLT